MLQRPIRPIPESRTQLDGIIAGDDRELLYGIGPKVQTKHAGRRGVGVVVDAGPVENVAVLFWPASSVRCFAVPLSPGAY